MKSNIPTHIHTFLSHYHEEVRNHAFMLRTIIIDTLPDIHETLDAPAKMIAYNYGTRYTDMICVLIPSKKGLKLGFYRGVDLPDPEKLLQGNGKISRYMEIDLSQEIRSTSLENLLHEAFRAYKIRTNRS